MKSKDKPYILHVAEKIYLEVSKIKKKNNGFSNIDAIDGFIGSETYKEVSSGKFHDNWFEELKKKKQAIESFLNTALRACNDSSFSNKKVQEMAFVRASTILNSLAQIKIWANENDLPFKNLIKD